MLTPERWAVVERVFQEALAHPAHARLGFLESSCGDDVDLRSEVESLLLADAAARSRASLAPEVAADWAADGSARLIGREVDGYRVVSLLGAGGMGEVFLADEPSLGRQVALKLLPAPFAADVARLHRFAEEARAASALNHPNIVTVHHIGDFDGRRYITTEFIDGETLRGRIARGPLAPGDAIEIALQVTRALAAAHEAGIVHRDIKPENIMIRRDGYVKVVDFGLAKMSPNERLTSGATPGVGATRTGAVIGTLAYMAPEQAAGATVDTRADLYSMAIVLYEMLTGGLPSAAIAAPDRAARRLPNQVRRLMQRALAHDPNARYQTAGELARDLDAVQRSLVAAPVRRRRRRLGAVAAALLMAVAIGVWMRQHATAPSVGSVAVLPFTSLDPSQNDQQHLNRGMTDALIARLAEARALKVTPASTIGHFIGSTRSPTEIGRELGVAAVVTGSLLRSGDRLQVTAQVLRVSDGEPLWTGRFDETFATIFSIQDGISQQIASMLALDVDDDALSRVRHRETRDSDAYDLYMRARERWARRTPDSIRQAITLFERALEIDPNFPLALAGMANAYALTASGLLPSERFPNAKAAALKALTLDNTLAEAHNALAFISYKWEWQWAAAEREFKRAIELEPNYALAHHWYSEYLSVIGRYEDALAGFAEAQNLDPYSTAIRVDRAAALVRASRAGDAVAVLRAAIAQDPKASAPHNGLFNALWVLGRLDEAFEAFERSRVLSGATQTDIDEMRATYRAGGFDALMRADLRHLLEVNSTGRSRGYYSRLSISGTIARHYAIIGERENALTWLEESARRRDDGPLAIRTMWYWQPYKDEPRFKAIERQLGMPAFVGQQAHNPS